MMKLQKAFFASVVASFVATSAASADVNLVIGGSIDVQATFANESERFERLDPLAPESDKRRRQKITNDVLIDLEVIGHSDKLNVNYGGKVSLEGNTSASKYNLPIISVTTAPSAAGGQDFTAIDYPLGTVFTPNANKNAREVMIFAESECIGRFEAGNTYSASEKFRINAASVAAGNGGIEGDALLHVHPVTGFGSFREAKFYTSKKGAYYLDDLFLPVDGALPFSTELATAGKVSYYTPNLNGVQIGISYTPDTDVTGSASQALLVTQHASSTGYGFKNVVEGGIAYSGKVGELDLQLSALAITGRAKAPAGKLFAADRLSTGTTTLEDLKGYEFGFATEYAGIGFAASYGRQDGLLSTLKDNEYYTVGAGYEAGPLAFSVNYMENSQKSNSFVNASGANVTREAELDNLAFDVAYNVQGLTPYLSVSKFKYTRPENDLGPEGQKNDGTVILLGTRLEF